ncbi:MAG: S8 family serine peptidase [Alcanivoracaceae bacterium]|nr:S8 family serine peptidase [Alcanivoracaceae bacterium]
MLKLNKLALSIITVLSTTAISTDAKANLDKQTVQINPLAPGIIVKYKNTSKSLSKKQSMQRAADMSKSYGIDLSFKRMMSGGAEVLSIAADQAKSLSVTDIQDVVNQLNKRADIEFAEIDALMVPYVTPNDTAFNTQWHYHEAVGGMRLPAAWDTTTGSSAVTVAVLDTGYRPHADLVGNIVGEYDMISSSAVAVDGGGRDSNAQDPGDFSAAGECGFGSPGGNSSWHGTHVAGTVAAVSNNNNDVAGVAWDVNLVPVRVLGKCGGSLSDIADGIRWASGISVSGVPANPNPAQVINMSLGSGSPTSCSSTYQNAINAAVNAGVTVVVAAGNSNSTSGFAPANCNNVVSVGATNRNGGRAYYSNFGSLIDVSAPGGDGCHPPAESLPTALADCEGGVWVDANLVQSTHNSGATTPGADSIGALQGTSMASPHVAGLAALMYSVKATTTPAEVESVLKSTARSFPNVNSHQCTTSICGTGIVDANAAVLALSNNPPVNIPPTASFTSSCTDLSCNFDASGSSDSDGTITGYSWSFGGSGVTASNTFASAGTFAVTLTVTDNDGATDSVTNNVSVTDPSSGNDITMTLGENNRGNKIKVFWSGATTTRVDIYRDGAFFKRTKNDGLWNDKNVSVGVTYTYQVCNNSSTTFCSNIDSYTL